MIVAIEKGQGLVVPHRILRNGGTGDDQILPPIVIPTRNHQRRKGDPPVDPLHQKVSE